MAATIDALKAPDSKLAREIAELVRDTETPLLFHHSSRVYHWGALTGRRRGLRFDHELLYARVHGRRAQGRGPRLPASEPLQEGDHPGLLRWDAAQARDHLWHGQCGRARRQGLFVPAGEFLPRDPRLRLVRLTLSHSCWLTSSNAANRRGTRSCRGLLSKTYHEDDHHFDYSLWHPRAHTLRSGRPKGASRFPSVLARLFLLGSVLALSPLERYSLLRRYL